MLSAITFLLFPDVSVMEELEIDVRRKIVYLIIFALILIRIATVRLRA